MIYSELESSNYTGIGISCGGGLCNVCVAYLSVPVLSFSIPRAGDYIDTNAAAMTGERANRVRIAKEDSFHFNGFFADKLQQVLGVYYDEMIQSLVQGMKQAFVQLATLRSRRAAAHRSERRNGAAGRLPRIVSKRSHRGRTCRSGVLGDPHGRRSAAYLSQGRVGRGAGGRVKGSSAIPAGQRGWVPKPGPPSLPPSNTFRQDSRQVSRVAVRSLRHEANPRLRTREPVDRRRPASRRSRTTRRPA